MSNRRALGFIAAIWVMTVPTGAAADPPTQLTPVPGVFSDMKYQAELWNFFGMEIFIVPGGNAGHFAMVPAPGAVSFLPGVIAPPALA